MTDLLASSGGSTSVGSFLDVPGEPWDYYVTLREAGDVVWDDRAEAWVVSSHELIRELALAEGDSVEMYPLPGRPVAYPENLSEEVMTETRISSRAIQLLDGKEHDIQHRWWMRAFTPRILNAWRDQWFRPICRAQIDRFVESGAADLAPQYAERIVPRIFTAMVGVPDADDRFIEDLEALFRPRQLLREVLGAEASVDPGIVERALEASRELKAWVWDLVMSRRDGEGDDLISMVWRDVDALFAEQEWNETDVVGVVTMVWDAGTHTTIYGISNALYLLLTRPDLRAEVDRDRSRLGGLVEESLRLYGPSYFTALRVALRDLELGAVKVKKGERIALMLGAGNVDPRRYECPMDASLDRERPRDHLAFYAGRRSCIGSMLARAEIQASVGVLLDRLPDVELDPDAAPPVYSGLTRTRRWAPLNVRFTSSTVQT